METTPEQARSYRLALGSVLLICAGIGLISQNDLFFGYVAIAAGTGLLTRLLSNSAMKVLAGEV